MSVRKFYSKGDLDMETIEVSPGMLWSVVTEQDIARMEQRMVLEKTPFDPSNRADGGKTVDEVASKHGWEVGEKAIRVIGQGEIPTDPVEVNGWKVMKATDYEGIVPQEAIERVKILLDEGVEIKGLLIADDLRKLTPKRIWQMALHTVERLRGADWRKARTDTAQRISTLAATGSKFVNPIFASIGRTTRPIQQIALNAIGRVKAVDWQRSRTKSAQGISALVLACTKLVNPIFTGMRRKSAETDWNKVKEVSGNIIKVMAIAVVGITVALAILPLLALVAVPFGLLAYDPWLIVVDSENRFWVVAEWFD
jgi:hypothetical protein